MKSKKALFLSKDTYNRFKKRKSSPFDMKLRKVKYFQFTLQNYLYSDPQDYVMYSFNSGRLWYQMLASDFKHHVCSSEEEALSTLYNSLDHEISKAENNSEAISSHLKDLKQIKTKQLKLK